MVDAKYIEKIAKLYCTLSELPELDVFAFERAMQSMSEQQRKTLYNLICGL